MKRWCGLARRSRGLVILDCWLFACCCACSDPVRDARITALGPETAGVAAGALHRPGQPCLACHDGQGDGPEHFTVAGTIYEALGVDASAPAVSIELVDARGERFQTVSNCAGNFYVTPAELDPVYPLWTSLTLGDYRIDMQSVIGRDGSCASCHAPQASQSATDPIYLYAIPDPDSPLDRTGCQ